MSATTKPVEDVATVLRHALIAYLESGETDLGARARLEALPRGREMLARALALKTGLAAFAGTGPSVDQYLEWKREEIEQERRRDKGSDAAHL